MTMRANEIPRRRILLVARDLQEYGLDTAQVKAVIRAADAKPIQADAIVFSLFTVATNGKQKVKWNHSKIQEALRGTGIRSVALEVGNFERGVVNPDLQLSIYAGSRNVRSFKIALGRSSSSRRSKQALMTDDAFNQRFIDGIYHNYCGEVGIISTKRGSEVIDDTYGFQRRLDERGVRVLASAFHSRARRWEVRKKHQVLSKGRLVLWVWSEWHKHGRSKVPWRIYLDERNRTDVVEEIPQEIAPGVRFGLVDTAKLIQ